MTAKNKAKSYDSSIEIEETQMQHAQDYGKNWHHRVTSMTRYPQMEARLLRNLRNGWAIPLLAVYSKGNYFLKYIHDVLCLFPDSRVTWARAASCLLLEKHREGWEKWDKETVLSILAHGQFQWVNFFREEA